MKIKRFSFKNNKTNWNVNDIQFGSLSLLVGASGVGKTLILKYLYSLSSIANGESFNGYEWNVEFETEEKVFIWSGQFEADRDNPLDSALPFEETSFLIIRESLVSEGQAIFTRNVDELIYNGQPTGVKLDSARSAVELLKQEPDVAPVKRAFQKILWLYLDQSRSTFVRPRPLFDPKFSLAEIKALKFYTPIDRFFLLKNNHEEIFGEIKNLFIDIFPFVEDISFDVDNVYEDKFVPRLKIKERGVADWIKSPNISSGMLRTLNQLITIVLADDGDVILIDEFENGLGINCIDSLADLTKDPEKDVQIIMTSHHPYIINSIPFKEWRIVSREGSDVVVNTAADLNIGQHSRHDAFMQLIQTPAYQFGLS